MPDEQFWSECYLKQQTGWDIGYASTPLIHFTAGFENKKASVLIPGCGNAYEAKVLRDQGFNRITLLDISPVLTTRLKQEMDSHKLEIITEDFFKHNQTYDLILEQTFFCALDPSLRLNYVKKMHELLTENGILVGVLFNRSFEGGPPYGGNREEYIQLFSAFFTILKMETCYNSIAPRSGKELFFIVRKKS